MKRGRLWKKPRDWESSTRRIIRIINTSRDDGRAWRWDRASLMLDLISPIMCIKLNLSCLYLITTQVTKTLINLHVKLERLKKNFILWSSPLGQGPPTPPTTPKTELHGGKQDLKQDRRRLLDSNRQNIDFSNVDISELGTDVIGNIETFDVREFDQYLPVSGHSGGVSELAHRQNVSSGAAYSNGAAWSRKGGGTSSSSATDDAAQLHRPHIKTEQLSPSHFRESSPLHSEYDACIASNGPQCDYIDLQNSSYYSPYSSYPSSLYPYPYFHSSRRTYGNPIVSIPPSHSPAPGWDQPVYTTLSRPWRDIYADALHVSPSGNFYLSKPRNEMEILKVVVKLHAHIIFISLTCSLFLVHEAFLRNPVMKSHRIELKKKKQSSDNRTETKVTIPKYFDNIIGAFASSLC